MSSRKILLVAAACAALASPALSQTTAPTPAPPSATQTPPAVPSPPLTAPGPVSEMFYSGSWMPTHWKTSDAIGQSVYNKANEKLGDVEDVLVDGDGRILAAVVGVGGFLGMGEHKVAVSYRSFQMIRDTNGKVKLMVDVDKATLKNAPQYKPTDAIKKI